MAGIPVEETCIMCPRRGNKQCGACKKAQYCSKVCQRLDFKNHKILCSSINDPKPRGNYRRALFFPGGEAKPMFVHLKIRKEREVIDGKVYSRWEEFDYEEYFDFGPEHTSHAQNTIQNRWLTAKQQDEVSLYVYTSGLAPQEAPNLAVQAFTRAGICGSNWRGPILVAYVKTTKGDNLRFFDIEMRHIRFIADVMSAEGRGMGRGTISMIRTLAAQVNCDGLVKADGKKYGDRGLAGDDYVYSSMGSGISNLLGIPLMIRKVTDQQTRSQMSSGWDNKEILLLKRDVQTPVFGPLRDAQKHQERLRHSQLLSRLSVPQIAADVEYVDGENGFGSSPEGWNNADIGPVLVARADGRPLYTEHIEAMCAYIGDVLEPLMSEAISGLPPGSPVTDHEAIMNKITKDNFETFYQEYKSISIVTDDNWSHILGPYDVPGPKDPQVKWLIDKAFSEQEKRGVPAYEKRGADPFYAPVYRQELLRRNIGSH